jgi:hypothetical protein
MSAKHAPLHPVALIGRLSFLRNGSARLTLTGADHNRTTVQLGPGYAARITQSGKGWLREATVSSASSCCAYVLTQLMQKGSRIQRRQTTSFISGVVREDTYGVDGKQLTRSSRWKYPNGLQIDATYETGFRSLSVQRGGQTVAQFSTKGRQTGLRLESITTRSDGAGEGVTVIGGKTLGLGKRDTFGTPGNKSYSTVSRSPSGVVTDMQVVHYSGTWAGVRVTTIVTDSSAGTVVSDETVTTPNPYGGGVTVESAHSETSRGGKQIDATSESQTNGQGGFSSVSEVRENGDTVQQSSYANDGKGNESQSTATFHPDGSFTIDTQSKDKDGNVSGGSQRYDKDGNPIDKDGNPMPSDGVGGGAGPGTDNSGSSGDGHQGGDGGDDTNPDEQPEGDGDYGPGGGAGPSSQPEGDGDYGPSGGPSPVASGEYPSDNGIDSGPVPSFSSPSDKSFGAWAARLDPFMGGNPGVAGPGDPGDPPNFTTLAGGEGGSGTSAPVMDDQDAATGTSVDMRPYLVAYRDPENNPRALVAGFAKLIGMSNDAGALRAANKAIEALQY